MLKHELERAVIDHTIAIAAIRDSIDTIKNNHLAHIQSDLAATNSSIQQMDRRLWAILILLIGSVVSASIAALWMV